MLGTTTPDQMIDVLESKGVERDTAERLVNRLRNWQTKHIADKIHNPDTLIGDIVARAIRDRFTIDHEDC